MLAIRKSRVKRNLTAFLGHRLVPSVTSNLRQPYGIDLVYSDTDMLNGQVFETILRRIKDGDFCIFDDRENEVRPNVFIELGACLNFQNKDTVPVGRRNEKVSTPSDLAGMLCVPYRQYEDRFLEFAMRLPGFLVDRRLAHEQ